MISTSADFTAAAKATVRQVKAKVDIIWTSPTEDSSIAVSGVDPEVDGYALFDGSDDQVQVPFGPGGKKQRTFAFTYYGASAVEAYNMGLFTSFTSGLTYEWFYISGTNIYYNRRYSTILNNVSTYYASDVITREAWQTIVLVLDIEQVDAEDRVRIWIDGSEITLTGSVADSGTVNNTANYQLGVYLTDANFKGKMRNVVMTETAWTQTDIDNYQNRVFGTTKALYRMNDADPGSPYTGGTVDSSGNGNHATPVGVDASFFNVGTISDVNRAANLSQLHDSNSDVLKRWAHLDGAIKADGVYKLMPNPETSGPKEQVGWYGTQRCGSLGTWTITTDPQIIMEFDARPVILLFVAGDTYLNEYPINFTITIYAGAVLQHTETVTGNTLVKWSKDVSSLSLASITKMILTINKWSTANRVVKISEFYTAFLQTFTGAEIVSMNLLEERVIGDGSLPIGNISSNELDLALNNVAITVNSTEVIDPFFPGNAASVYYELIRKNRRVEPYIGFLLPSGSIEYVKLGVFWTGDWTVNEQDYAASVSCRDRMERLRKAEYKTSTLFEDTTLYDIVVNILNHARTNIPMSDLTWRVDTELQNYTIAYAWFPIQSYFTTIKQIVEACMGQAYMSKTDVLIIEGPSALSSESPTLTFGSETLTFGSETLTF